MSEALVEFNYEGCLLKIQCNPDEKMEDILKKFATKVLKKKEQFYFIYGGGMINEKLTFKEQVNVNDQKRNAMSILVNKIDDESNQERHSLKKSKYIICPKCKESARISINNYKIEIYGCKNGHKTDNILMKDFKPTQDFDEAKINCQKCNKINKSASYGGVFFFCFECNINLCQLCKSIHDKSHNIIDYDDKIFTCNLHYESYYSYCMDCKKDICLACESEHKGHEILSYGSILPNQKKLKEDLNGLAKIKEVFKKEIEDIINKLNDLIFMLNDYSKIFEDIINSYGSKRRNYFLLQNIQNINNFNNHFIKTINLINEERETSKKIIYIIDLFNNMKLNNNDKILFYTDKNNSIKNTDKLDEKEQKKQKKNENISYYIKEKAKIQNIDEKPNCLIRKKEKVKKPYNEIKEKKQYNGIKEKKPYNEEKKKKPYYEIKEKKPYYEEKKKKPYYKEKENRPYSEEKIKKPYNEEKEKDIYFI